MYIRNATRRDLSEIAIVSARAMMRDELSLWLSPTQNDFPHIHRERCLRTTINRWNSGKKMLVMETEEGDEGWNGSPMIIAYAAYEKEVGAPDDSSKVSKTISAAIERFLYSLESRYIWHFRGNLNTDRSRWLRCYEAITSNAALNSIERYWELDFLAVDPAFGRRGIGSRLISWGKERATEDNVPLLLWSSEQGFPLYSRHGFKEVALITFDSSVVAPVMRWDPPSML